MALVDWRPRSGDIPAAPGVYRWLDADGRVLYVGKAKSLRQRLSNYFADPRSLAPRTAQMVQTAETVEWIQVRNEVEALMLEYALIQLHKPRFNVRLRDDKSYPFLAVTVDEKWPRALVMRGRKRKGTRYFGPYGHAYAIRETLDLLLRSFPIRTCSPSKFNQHERLGRPPLHHRIGLRREFDDAGRRETHDPVHRRWQRHVAADRDMMNEGERHQRIDRAAVAKIADQRMDPPAEPCRQRFERRRQLSRRLAPRRFGGFQRLADLRHLLFERLQPYLE